MRHNLLLVIWNLFSDSEPRERVMLSKTILKNWKEKTNKQTNKQQWKLPVPVLVGCLFGNKTKIGFYLSRPNQGQMVCANRQLVYCVL